MNRLLSSKLKQKIRIKENKVGAIKMKRTPAIRKPTGMSILSMIWLRVMDIMMIIKCNRLMA
jgi:hypothetical protein